MRALTVQMTLADLQEALLDYCFKKGCPQPDAVYVASHSKGITVELRPGGIVDADEFRHRAHPD
jgi:hypothetical protein